MSWWDPIAKKVEAEVTDAYSWPDFKRFEVQIIEILKRDIRVSLKEAYLQVSRPVWLAELNGKTKRD